MRHLPALDGLRGIALCGVLLFHANGALPGGYLGVDLFFVLSGFLITSLLVTEHAQTGRIALSAFWVRRARRLAPALLSLMPAIAIYGRYFARADELKSLRAQALATLGYVANWQTIFEHKSYWQLFSSPSPLEHTWSLSIEEQFYVLWPLVVTLVLRRGASRALLVISLVLSALSMSAMWLLFDPANTTRAYLGTDTRMAGILAGAALATLISPNQSISVRATRALDALGALSIVGLGVAWCKLSGTSAFLYRGGFWLTELGALVLIACAVAGERSLVARALSFRPFRLLGAISYGVYLWHWPVNVFLSPGRVHMHGFALHALHLSLTFAIAIASYRFLEQPIRRHGVPFSRPLFIVPAALALSVFLVVRATYARPVRSSLSALLAKIPLPAPDAITFRVMVFGDSTANSLGWGLRSLREKGVDVQLMGKDGCTMLADLCEGPHWVEQVREQHPNVSIVYLAGAFLHGFSVKGNWHTACRLDWDQKFERVLSLRLRELEAEAGLVFTSTIPYPVGRYDTREFRDEVDCINTSIRKTVDAVPGVQLIDVGARLCPGGVCQQDIGGDEPVRPDGVHFSIDSAQSLWRWVYEEIRR
ncbi:MAG TPA: acyltransferase family protein [Polyangiaceae bacterium]|jgi:peptidoglycan/LPS O-acetylase OafA/YrhL|nr:acyltransferase family protein [Polyangiaceae bacterium]